jgi:hypothetical protein
MKKVASALIAGLIVSVTPASAALSESPLTLGGFMRADALYNLCVDAENAPKTTMCLSYIMGAADAAIAFDGIINKSPAEGKICVPQGTKMEKIRDAFVSYILDNPDDRTGRAGSVIGLTLYRNFPCR